MPVLWRRSSGVCWVSRGFFCNTASRCYYMFPSSFILFCFSCYCGRLGFTTTAKSQLSFPWSWATFLSNIVYPSFCGLSTEIMVERRKRTSTEDVRPSESAQDAGDKRRNDSGVLMTCMERRDGPPGGLFQPIGSPILTIAIMGVPLTTVPKVTDYIRLSTAHPPRETWLNEIARTPPKRKGRRVQGSKGGITETNRSCVWKDYLLFSGRPMR